MPVVSNIYFHLYEDSRDGQRPPVILIHGAGGNHLFWPPAIRRLPGYQIYAVDLPGHGKSGGVGQQSISAYSNVIIEWLGELEMHSAIFIGHSMGSAITISLALDYPEHVLGLGLIGSGARLRVNPDILERTENQSTFFSAIQKVVNWSFSENTPERFVELAEKRMAEVRPSVLRSDFLACDSFDETDRLERISQPTLILCGSEDQMTPPRYSQLLADRIPNAKFKSIPEAGHMVMLEQPEIVGEEISDFLSEIRY